MGHRIHESSRTTHGALLLLAGLAWPAEGLAAGAAGADSRGAALRFPTGTVSLPFENVEGVILVHATVRGRDAQSPSDFSAAIAETSGWFALDTGAGFLAIDSKLAVSLGICDGLSSHSIDVAQRPLAELSIGDMTLSQVKPVVVFDARLLRSVTDRPVLGLIGFEVLRDRALWIDYRTSRAALIPAGPDVELEDAPAIGESRRVLAGALSPRAVPIRFRMTSDGKVLLRARVTPVAGGGPTPWLNMLLDTGAAKSTLFADVVAPQTNTAGWRPALRGLIAPTLAATSSARLCRVRRIEARGSSGTAEATNVDLALIENPLAGQLERLAGEPVHGLLGYSFLQRFRMACDYPRRVLWLDPVPGYRDQRPNEHVHVGLQLDRTAGSVRVVAVAEGSPAAVAGIAAGDELLAIDGASTSAMSWQAIGQRMEGRAGSRVELKTRRGAAEHTYNLRRRKLL